MDIITFIVNREKNGVQELLCSSLKLEHLQDAKFQHFMLFLPPLLLPRPNQPTVHNICHFHLISKSHKAKWENIDSCTEEHYVKSGKIKNGGKPSSSLENEAWKMKHEEPPAKISFNFTHSGSLKTDKGYTLPLTPQAYFSHLKPPQCVFCFHLINQLILQKLLTHNKIVLEFGQDFAFQCRGCGFDLWSGS